MTYHALRIAERLLDPTAVTDAVPESDAASLTHGLAGTALLHARLSAIDPTFATAALHHWTTAAKHLRRHPAPLTGIQGGHGGLTASLIIGAAYLPDPPRCRARTTDSARWLAHQAHELASNYLREPGAGPSWHIYDAITGLTGIGRVLLAAAQDGFPDVAHGLHAALKVLTGICAPTETARPGWWMPRAHHPHGSTIDSSGAAHTGAAHGIAGPLAFLATAHQAGWTVLGQTDAIDHAATWLLNWRHPDQTWPPYITGTELDTHTPPTTLGRRDAWCYGTPGIAHALTLAGHARHTPQWTKEAEQALARLADRPPHNWDTDGPALCHGTAGVLHTTTRHHPALAHTAATATIQALNPTGFDDQHHKGHHRLNEPGLLTGDTGTALALADHEQLPTHNTTTSWDSLLNMS